MPDTHDERGQDADPYDWDPVYAAATIAELQKQLAAATARAAKWESVYRQLHDDRDQWQDAAVKAADERDAATARAESATVLPERWRALIAERDEAVRRVEEAEAERDGHRARQREAEDALAMLLTREGGGVEFSVAEMTSFSRRGSFVSSRNIATGGERLAYVTAAPKSGSTRSATADAAPDGRSATLRAEDGVQASGSELEFEGRSAGLSEPELFADACDCECQPGQPCLCPERDCYCGPCRVCGDNPQQPDDTTEDDRG